MASDLPSENVKCALVLAAAPQKKKKQFRKIFFFQLSKDSVADLQNLRDLRQITLEHFFSITGQTTDSLLVTMEREWRYSNA